MTGQFVSCEAVLQKSAAWLDEQLSPGEMELIGMHLEHCSACAEHLSRLDDVDLRPLRIHHSHPSRRSNYWESMDQALNKEMDVLHSGTSGGRSIFSLNKGAMLVLAASFLFTLFWGLQQQDHVVELQTQIELQKREIERMERMYATPISPKSTPASPYPVHVPARVDL